MAKSTAIIQKHHITYDPEHVVELKMLDHRAVSRWQQTRATDEQYSLIINFLHALSFEANRIRAELDTGDDLRVKKQND